MKRRLALDDQQFRQVEEILRRRQAALQEIRREFQPLIETELDRVEDEISAVLSDEQRQKWESHFGHLRRTWIPSPPSE